MRVYVVRTIQNGQPLTSKAPLRPLHCAYGGLSWDLRGNRNRHLLADRLPRLGMRRLGTVHRYLLFPLLHWDVLLRPRVEPHWGGGHRSPHPTPEPHGATARLQLASIICSWESSLAAVLSSLLFLFLNVNRRVHQQDPDARLVPLLRNWLIGDRQQDSNAVRHFQLGGYG